MVCPNLCKFVDCQFPPNNSSIYSSTGLSSDRLSFLFNHIQNLIQPYEWLRPEDLKVTANNECFPLCLCNHPGPSDIVQGADGSCWLSSALSSLTTSPSVLDRIFHDFHSTAGIYRFRLCIRGIWQVVTVDDLVPAKASGKPVFGKLINGQLYPLLLEKALAKVYGSFEAISYDSDCAETGLQILTGHPCDSIVLDKSGCMNKMDCQWNEIECALQNKCLLTACASDKQINPILDACEFLYHNEYIRLVKLRDPKGGKRIKGDWLNRWSHLPKQVNDNSFWVGFEDVCQNFQRIIVNKVRPSWTSARLSSVFQDYANCIECYTFDIGATCQEIDIELFANGRRNEMHEKIKTSSKSLEIDLCLILAKIMPDGSYQCIEYKHEVNGSINLSCFIASSGRYIVLATSIKAITRFDAEIKKTDCFDASSNYFQYNIVFHSPHSLCIERTCYPATVVSDLFYSVAVLTNSFTYHLNDEVRISVLATDWSYALFAENLSYSNSVSIAINGAVDENVVSSRLHPNTKDYLGPRQRQCLVFYVRDKVKGRSSIYRIRSEYTVSYLPAPCCLQPNQISDLFFHKSFLGLYYFKRI